MSPRYSSDGRSVEPASVLVQRRPEAAPTSDPNGVSGHQSPRAACVEISASARYDAAPRSIGAASPAAAFAQEAARNSSLVATRSCARVRTRSGSTTTTVGVERAARRRAAPCRRPAPGPATPCPRRRCPRRACSSTSAQPGVLRASSAAARARTSAVSSSSRHGGAHRPCRRDLEAPLVGDLEPADLLDGVAPELDPQRVLLGRREDVEDAAAHGELAARSTRSTRVYAAVDQPLDDLVQHRSRRPTCSRTGSRSPSPTTTAAAPRAPARRRPRAGRRRSRRVRVGQPAQHREPASDGVGPR